MSCQYSNEFLNGWYAAHHTYKTKVTIDNPYNEISQFKSYLDWQDGNARYAEFDEDEMISRLFEGNN